MTTRTQAPSPQTPAAPALDRRRQAAIVVRGLLAAGSRVPLAGLHDDAQADLAREMGRLSVVDRETLHAVLTEFADRLEQVGLAGQSGVDGALAQLGDQVSPAVVARLRAEQGGAGPDPWGGIVRLPVATLAAIAEGESLEVAAVLLSKLPVPRAAEVLEALPGERSRRVALALSRIGPVAPATVRRIGQALLEAHGQAEAPAFPQSAGERLGAILNSSARTTRDGLLEALDAEDGGIAAEVRRAIFTFPHLSRRLLPADVPRVLRGADMRQVATALVHARALGGEDAAAAEFILASLPQRLADSIREEMEGVGSPKPADGDAAQAAFVALVRERAEAGEIVLVEAAEA